MFWDTLDWQVCWAEFLRHIPLILFHHRALFTLFQLQFGAMSPNRAIKLECVSSIVWDKALAEDVHYASLVDMKLKELSVLHCADPQFCQEHKPVLNTSCQAICDCLIQSAKHCIPITSACKQVARWSAVDGLWFPLCWSHSWNQKEN